MPNNNPAGINNPQPQYGDLKKQQGLQRESPIPSAPGANAARQAQRSAVRGKRSKAKQQQPKVLERPKDAFHPTSAPPEEPQAPGVAQVWAEIAAIPGVTPLAQELAQRAASGGL